MATELVEPGRSGTRDATHLAPRIVPMAPGTRSRPPLLLPPIVIMRSQRASPRWIAVRIDTSRSGAFPRSTPRTPSSASMPRRSGFVVSRTPRERREGFVGVISDPVASTPARRVRNTLTCDTSFAINAATCQGRIRVPASTILEPRRKSSPRRAMSCPRTPGTRDQTWFPVRRHLSNRMTASAPCGRVAPVRTSTAVANPTLGIRRMSSPGAARPTSLRASVGTIPRRSEGRSRIANPSIVDWSCGGNDRRARMAWLTTRPKAADVGILSMGARSGPANLSSRTSTDSTRSDLSRVSPPARRRIDNHLEDTLA